MEKISAEQFAARAGTDTITLLVTTEGVVVQRLGEADKTIARFDASDVDSEAADAIRNATAHYLGLHATKLGAEATTLKAKQSAAFIKEALASGRISGDAEVSAAKATLAKLLDVPVAAISAEEQAERDRLAAIAAAEQAKRDEEALRVSESAK